MKCINFDRAFERYMAGWMKENSEKYKDDMDVIEDMMPDVYLEFLQKPADFLDGVAPQNYFEQFDDADMLVGWLCDYIAQGVPVPDLLLERITSLGESAEKSLLALLDRTDLQEETEMTVVSPFGKTGNGCGRPTKPCSWMARILSRLGRILKKSTRSG